MAALLAAEAGPATCIPSRMYLSPTGVRMTWPPAASTTAWSPPFERTDTTRAPSGRTPRSRRSRARTPRTWSPSTTCPRASTAISRSASPSRANPTSAPRAVDRRGERGRRRRPGLDVDVHAVGLVVDDLDRRPGRREDLGPDHPARAVRAVEDDPQARRRRSPGEAEPVLAVALEQVAARRLTRPISALPTPPSSSVRQMSCSSSSSTASSSFRPGRVEHLEAVVVGRVVRRRDHDPGRESPVPARKASAGVGTTAGDLDVDAEARRAGRIAATNMSPERRVSWPTTSAPPGPDELVGRRPAERVGERRLQLDVGDATDSVRAEEARHATGDAEGRDGDGAGGTR